MMIPILFKPDMVNAILKGNKTQTRRVKGLKEINKNPNDWEFRGFWYSRIKKKWYAKFYNEKTDRLKEIKAPYGNPNTFTEDVYLWVRETVVYRSKHDRYYYKADDLDFDPYEHTGWKPSIHMPKAACRLFLENINTRIERLHDIENEDAISEGIQKVGDSWKNYIPSLGPNFPFPVNSFMSLWESINGNDSWDKNPWVWVVEFKKTDKPADWPT